MRIKTLKIENLRGLSDVDFEFDQATNVIVGPNAIGKTTVLEAVRLVIPFPYRFNFSKADRIKG